MITHPILGQVAPVESLGRATLEAIESSGRCSIPKVLVDINARALELPAFGQWQPIETFPKDGTRALVCNAAGVWVAEWVPVYPSGFRADNPLHSVMLNRYHIPEAGRCKAATHWKPLPPPHGAAPQPAPAPVQVDELTEVARVLDEGAGIWRSCSGCCETSDGYNVSGFPFSEVFRCNQGGGCDECGGIGVVWDNLDYAAAEDTAHPPTPAADGAGEFPHAVRFFAADENNSDYEVFDSVDLARAAAQRMLDSASDDAADYGWPDEFPSIYYGIVLGACVESYRGPAPDGSDFSEIVNYRLTDIGEMEHAAIAAMAQQRVPDAVRKELLLAWDLAGDVCGSALLAAEPDAMNDEHCEAIRKKAQRVFIALINTYSDLVGHRPEDDESELDQQQEARGNGE